ncbi:MAG TPA: HlyD family efflux transporter periplasmic adaptor subunit [Rhizomicrobium sp.]|jgi:membrane fusion protein (multidrug efflux system)|nr:HlyD family efflux transporter periplasmic adaptor subunit [Rhizomicrobium sp.]
MSDVAIDDPKFSAFVQGKSKPVVDPAVRRKALRRRLFMAFGAVLFLAGGGAGTRWWITSQRYVSTDDAYVAADSADVTPQVSGTIGAVPVTDTMRIKRGQVLVRLDPSDAQLALEQAAANYGQAVRQVRQNFANADEAAAQIAGKSSDVERASLDYQRRVALMQQGAIAAQDLSNAKNTLETARSALVAARETLAAQQALVRGTDVEHNPQVLQAKAAVDTARLNLSRTVIRAPFDGVVAQKTAQIGERVDVGQVLMTVVPVNQAYVNANFKEGQLTRVRKGQTVTLTSDLYGSGVPFRGRVEGLSGGTGSAFAVIPAQNATGNWIKVVQRLPVRVALDSRELEQHPLRVGLSMKATIDVAQ